MVGKAAWLCYPDHFDSPSLTSMLQIGASALVKTNIRGVALQACGIKAAAFKCIPRESSMQMLSRKNHLDRYGSFSTESEFHQVADRTLQNLFDEVSVLEDSIETVDINLHHGVLAVDFYELGETWVVNKQIANQQIWWSSPRSGPMRFEYDMDQEEWLSSRSKQTLSKLIQEEISFCVK